jgi:phosphotransferase system enzyme I (PtsI)
LTDRVLLHGQPTCPGIAFGTVHALDRSRLSVPRFRVAAENKDAEVARFERAVDASEQQLQQLQVRAAEQGFDQVVALLQAHGMILRDGAFFEATRARITDDGHNAEWALHATVREVRRLFEHLEQDYFRQRRSDVDTVGDRVLRNLLGTTPDPLADLPPDAVIATRDLSPADTLALSREDVRAFITVGGGRTSHAAILARALGVPCVLGIPELLHVVTGGEPVVVDGGMGVVVLHPDEGDVSRYRGLARRRAEQEAALLADRDLPAETTDGERVALLGNIEVQQEAQAVLRVGGEGIGLYRTEFLGFDGVGFEDTDAQARLYSDVVRTMDGRPTIIRTLDLGGDKERGSLELEAASTWSTVDLPIPTSDSPLGARAIRLSLAEREGFRAQLQAILRASAQGPVRILLPFVTDVSEVRAVREELDRVKSQLSQLGLAYDPQLPLGVMIETPAAVFSLAELSRCSDFFAVGTNDLIQFIMAADRSIEAVAHLVRPCHPAVLRVLDKIRREAQRPVSICGEVAADPFMAPLLIGLGFRDLSMSPASIPVVKRIILKLDSTQCRQLADRALDCEQADEVEMMVTETLRSWTPELLGLDLTDSEGTSDSS